jgi:hypothetical protein
MSCYFAVFGSSEHGCLVSTYLVGMAFAIPELFLVTPGKINMQLSTKKKINKKASFDGIALTANSVPGRVRLSVPALYRTDGLSTRIHDGLIQHSGILKVQVNPLTGNVLVVYRSRKRKLNEIIQILERVLK